MSWTRKPSTESDASPARSSARTIGAAISRGRAARAHEVRRKDIIRLLGAIGSDPAHPAGAGRRGTLASWWPDSPENQGPPPARALPAAIPPLRGAGRGGLIRGGLSALDEDAAGLEL